MIQLQGPADGKVRCTLWSASSKTDPASWTRGYAVQAAPDAPEGTREFKVLATAGAVRREGTLKISVKKADAR